MGYFIPNLCPVASRPHTATNGKLHSWELIIYYLLYWVEQARSRGDQSKLFSLHTAHNGKLLLGTGHILSVILGGAGKVKGRPE